MCHISDCNTSLIVSDLLSVVSHLIAARHASTTHSPYNTQTCSSPYADGPYNYEQRARQAQCATTPTSPKALSPYNSHACPPAFSIHAPYQNHVRQAQASQEQAEVSPNYRSIVPRSPDETGGSRSTPTIYDDYIAHKEPTSPTLPLNNSHSSAAISNEHVTPPPTSEAGSDPRGHLWVTWGVYLCAGKPPLADIILSHPPDLTRCDSVIGLAIPAMSGHIQYRGAAN